MGTSHIAAYSNLALTKGDTFIGKYMEMMDDLETPKAYDFWCALWLVSLAVGRATVVARPKAPVYLNLYAILCAESGVTRKSTAVRCAERIAGKFLARIGREDVLLTTKVSPEALTLALHAQSEGKGTSHAAIAVSEMVTFLGREKYVSAMPGLLTDLYDCPRQRNSVGTVRHGKTLLRDVWVNLLSASTPSWLVTSVNPNIVEGGFTSRCFFIHSEKRKHLVAWPEESEDRDEELVEELLSIHRMAPNVPGIDLNEKALERFKNWYKRRELHSDPFRASFESREDSHVLRVAALLCINRKAWLINKDDIQNGIRLVSAVKLDGYRLFTGFIDANKAERGLDRIRSVLLNAGGAGVAERDLVRGAQHYAHAPVVKRILSVLHEMKAIDVVEVESGSTGKYIRYYSAKPELGAKQTFVEACQKLRGEI